MFIFFFVGTVNANTVAKISSVLLYEGDNIVYIYPAGGVQNPPQCHGANGNYLTFKMDRPMAKEYLSVLMYAFAAQKQLLCTYGDCIEQPHAERSNIFCE